VIVTRLLLPLRPRYVLMTYRKSYMAIVMVTLNLTFDLGVKVICENMIISRLLLSYGMGTCIDDL
jgi:hypothetical protein